MLLNVCRVLFVAAACVLATCSAQPGVNTTFYLDMNCTAPCSNCTVSNPIITAGGCVRERVDVNSSSSTAACNATHVTGARATARAPRPTGPSPIPPPLCSAGSSYQTSNCSGVPVPFAHEVGACRPFPASPGSFYARTVCPAQPTFATLTPMFSPVGFQSVGVSLGFLLDL